MILTGCRFPIDSIFDSDWRFDWMSNTHWMSNRIHRKSTSSEYDKPTRTWYTLWEITIYISWEGFTRISVNLRFRKLQTNRQDLVWGNSYKWDITLGSSFPIILYYAIYYVLHNILYTTYCTVYYTIILYTILY
jgi:hypothetical protein